MARAYAVDFTITLGTVIDIEADSREEALEVARRLQGNSDFYGSQLIERWDSDHTGWWDPNEPKVLAEYDDEEPTFAADDIKKWIGE